MIVKQNDQTALNVVFFFSYKKRDRIERGKRSRPNFNEPYACTDPSRSSSSSSSSSSFNGLYVYDYYSARSTTTQKTTTTTPIKGKKNREKKAFT